MLLLLRYQLWQQNALASSESHVPQMIVPCPIKCAKINFTMLYAIKKKWKELYFPFCKHIALCCNRKTFINSVCSSSKQINQLVSLRALQQDFQSNIYKRPSYYWQARDVGRIFCKNHLTQSVINFLIEHIIFFNFYSFKGHDTFKQAQLSTFAPFDDFHYLLIKPKSFIPINIGQKVHWHIQKRSTRGCMQTISIFNLYSVQSFSLFCNPMKVIQTLLIYKQRACDTFQQHQNLSHTFNNLYKNTNYSTHKLTTSKPNKTHFNNYNKPNMHTHHNQWNPIVPNSLNFTQMKKPWHTQTISSSNFALFQDFYFFAIL